MNVETSIHPPLSSFRDPRFWVPAALTVVAATASFVFWDRPVTHFFYAVTDPWVEESAQWLTDFGTVVRPEMAVLVWLIYRKRRPDWARAAVFFFVAVFAAGAVNIGLKAGFGRSRPELFLEQGIYGIHFFCWDAAYWSMPSGHTASAMAAMTVLSLLFPRASPIFLLQAALVGYSRVALLEHFASDVMMGCVVGGAVALVLHDLYFGRALRRLGWWRTSAGVNPETSP